jgi:hypothetical protein
MSPLSVPDLVAMRGLRLGGSTSAKSLAVAPSRVSAPAAYGLTAEFHGVLRLLKTPAQERRELVGTFSNGPGSKAKRSGTLSPRVSAYSSRSGQ